MANEHSFDMSNPVDLYDNYTERSDMNIQQLPLQEYGDIRPSCPVSHLSVFQPTAKDSDTDLQENENDGSDLEIMNDIVIFHPDAEPDTLDEYEYHFKNPLSHMVEETRKLDYARHLDELGKFILE